MYSQQTLINKTALVVGATGISGSNLASKLIENGWKVYGLSRKPKNDIEGLQTIAADLLSIESLTAALKEISPTHVFFTTWMRNDTEDENIRVNSAMIRNLLDVLSIKKTIMHVSLVTGLKHYLGPFDAYATTGTLPDTPLREEQPRLDIKNFYYAQEDEVYTAAARDGFTWNIHRPHTLIGKTIGNAMNMGTTLAVYASICKKEGLPFIWPGSEAQWNGLSDVTDAKVLADQIIWAATSSEAYNLAFNITNGDVFRWKWLWPKIAEWFEIDFEGYNGTIKPLQTILDKKDVVWREIAQNKQLIEEDINQLASAWHTDLDLGRPLEVMTDMSRSRKLGFSVYKATKDSFFELFAQLRNDKIIP
ncbi:SDR family oxidoreductase [Flavobacterium sp. Fl-77]|uniref:SDR family oxidoreductase n=1 Tax=Flavobacterium flavipigmentatum TaxID=2893884 RepID=A0AAJ2SAU4_9FLAO|nr:MULTISPECIES: SDR family oxidoreductase [unclassified Flavobacterium]MDX6182039.1 SDR family oxidoreductase [Flavobacterium sp. Fl-33]MDX6186906.1 SDR family oxidoreductase [Flavobacterium sp. Fl-77]UFH37040.1 SDR family oxidoreductase [Flavobacterium sp. F-70]